MKRRQYTFNAVVVAGSAFADRGFLAIATFASSILLGRWAGPEQLGVFALFSSIVFATLAFHDALITAPYNVLAVSCRTAVERRQYLGGVLVHTLVMSLLMALAIMLLAIIVSQTRFSPYAGVTAILAPVIPCLLIRELARRVVYADMQPLPAALLSLGVSVGQLLLMALLHQWGRLSALTTLVAMGIASLAGGAVWLAANRDDIHIDRREVRASLARNWAFGRWSTLAQSGEVIRVHMFPWLLALAVDERDIGIFAACATLAGLTGPAQVALSNLLTPHFAAVHLSGGIAAISRAVRRTTWWTVAAMTAITAAMIVASAQLVPWVYGPAYVGVQAPLVILLVGHWIAGATLSPARALYALRRADLDFACNACGIVVTLLAGVPLVLGRGILGAAIAYLVGALAKGLLSVFLYRREVYLRSLLREDQGSSDVADRQRGALAEYERVLPPVAANEG